MSLYNILFGFDPLAHGLIQVLGINPLHIPRFRDCFLLEGKIAIYTRTGGGNREINAAPWVFEGEVIPRTVAPDCWDNLCAQHPDYLGTEDDDYDETYAFWWFRYPDAVREDLNAHASKHERERPSKRWKALGKSMKDHQR
jgi:hypothetical protein